MKRLRSTLPLADVVVGAQLLWSLPRFLRHRVSLEEARAIVQHRVGQRQADFLALARRLIFGRMTTPYRELLSLAGCEYGDLQRLVSTEGVEGTLRVLFRHGIYLTVDELKGRRPAVRGTTAIEVQPAQLSNPDAKIRVPRHTGGSRGPSMAAPFDLAHVRERAVGIRLYLEARGALGWRHANWEAPGGGTIIHLLEYSVAGAPMVRWFTPFPSAAPGLQARYRWVGHALRMGGLLAGRPPPLPAHASLGDPLPIARWMADTLRRREIPHLLTYSSCAVRVCRAAGQAGIDLNGARFTVVGEPFTPARAAAVRHTGAEAVARFGSAESSAIGSGCLAPEGSDDMHHLHDLTALIQPGADGARVGLPPRALLITSLRPAAPLMLLNVSLGDEAELIERRCGCPMERYGWPAHLRTVRSFEKLTAGGMTFLDTDVIRVLEWVLPARFGGGPLDYQLVEDEAGDGQPVVRLLVSPAAGPMDPAAVAEAFLSAIAGQSMAEAAMAMQWRQAGLPIVERRTPHVTGSNKVLHLHQRHDPTR